MLLGFGFKGWCIKRNAWTKFEDEAVIFEEGHVVLFAKMVHLLDDGEGHGKNRPLGASDATAGFEIKKVVVPPRVVDSVESDGAGGAMFHGVGRIVVVEDMNIGSEFKREEVAVERTGTGDDGEWRHGGADAMFGREQVAAANYEIDDFGDDEAWEALKRETMGERPSIILDGTDRSFDGLNVSVSSTLIKMNGQDVIFNTFKFSIAFKGSNFKTSRTVDLLYCSKLVEKISF